MPGIITKQDNRYTSSFLLIYQQRYMKRLLITACIFVGACYCCYAQSPDAAYLKDLQAALKNSLIDTGRLHTLNKLGNYYDLHYKLERKSFFLDSALITFQKAVKLSEVLRVDTGYGKNENECMLGKTYMLLDDTVNGRLHFMQAINYYRLHQNRRQELRTWAFFGDTYILNNHLVQQRDCYYQGLQFAKKYGLINNQIELRGKIASTTYHLHQFDLAIAQCLAIVHDFPDNPSAERDDLDEVYNLLARIYRYKGNLNKALYYALECIKSMELHHDTYWMSNFYGELAQIYEDLGQTEKSIIWYRKTLAIREQKEMPDEYIYRTAGFIVQGLIKQKKYNEALAEITGLEKRRSPQTDLGSAVIYQIKGYCYDALKEYGQAEKCYLKMIKLYERAVADREIVAIAYYDISKFYVEQKKYPEAEKFLADTVTGFLSLTMNKNREFLYFKVDSAAGKYTDAIKHFSIYKSLNDSIFNAAKSKQIEELQIKYETDQKEKDIRVLQKERHEQQYKVKQANLVRNLTLCGIVMLLLTLGLLYNSFRINQKKTKEIDIKNSSLGLLIDEKDSLLAEKEDLMKEIHHRVKNNLQIVMGLLQRQSAFITNEDALLAIRNSEHRMHSIALIHQKLYQSDSFTRVNMVDYIDEMTGYLRDSYDLGTRIQFEKQIENIDLEISVAVPLGLILNEAITNAIKYAFPGAQKGSIFITINQVTDESYLLGIRDNGVGLPKGFDIKKISSMGFNLMLGLSKQVGGSFKIENHNGVSIAIDFRTDLHSKLI
jgi:two-component sensor histidine kinase